jgi:orotate phosphoribosyltransferase-like protein
MVLDVALIGASMTKAFVTSLKTSSSQLKALAAAEAEKFAVSLATIARLLAAGEVDQEEAEVLIGIQKSATESVLSSLAGVSAVAARRATRAALTSVVASVDSVIGIPLIGTSLAAVNARPPSADT